jgi:hypothetical protein
LRALGNKGDPAHLSTALRTQQREHPLMGTHNRRAKIATAQHRTTYLEIIAIN